MKKYKKIALITIISVPILILLVIFAIFHYGYKDAVGRDVYKHYGKNNEIIIGYTEDNLSIIINGETRENKIYYLFENEEYLYLINKWNRFTVVSLSFLIVEIQTEDLSKMPDVHQKVFLNRSQFEELRRYDEKKKQNAVEIGDGTLFIRVLDELYLYTEKNYASNKSTKVIETGIEKFKVKDNYIYLIDVFEEYFVADILTYTVVLHEDDLSKMEEEYKVVFQNENGFATKDDVKKRFDW